MYSHSVTQFSEEGLQLKTYDTLTDAERQTGELKSSIRSQVNGERKYSFWHSHILRNDIVLRNGTIIKIEKLILSKLEIEMEDYLLKNYLKYKDYGIR